MEELVHSTMGLVVEGQKQVKFVMLFEKHLPWGGVSAALRRESNTGKSIIV